MNLKSSLQIFKRWFAVFAMACALTACASAPPEISHSFGFDLRQDNQDAVILDYRYGSPEFFSVHASEWAIKEGKTYTFEGISGPMYRPESLYVKWRNKNTGQVYEDTVDLRHRLPKNIIDHTVYLMIRGPQLYVYLIPPEGEKRLKGEPPNGPSMYSDLKTITIYPDQVKP